MAKLDNDRVHSPARTSGDDAEYHEDQPLRQGSHNDREEIEAFAIAHNLVDEVALLHKASAFLDDDTASGDERLGLTDAEILAIQRERTHQWHQPWRLYFTIAICSLGAIEQGWAQTGINGANIYIPQALHIDSGSAHDAFVLGLINCGLYLANALCGSWLAQPVNERVGRRGAILIGSAICLLGNFLSAVSGNWPLLVLSRLALGIGLGLNASTVSVFAAESSPVNIRGGLAVSWQMFTAFGIFIGFLANVALYTSRPDIIWRLQLGAPLLPAIPLLLLIFGCPESPAWLMKQGRYDLAFASLIHLRNTKFQAACELCHDYQARRMLARMSTSEPTTFLAKLYSLFAVPRNRHAVYASYTVMITQQLCGINIIAFYSSTIFASSGFSALAALWASVIFGFVNFVGAFPAVWTMDSFGRRKLLLWTLPFMAIIMAFTSAAFALPAGTTQLWVLAGLIYLFCAVYSPGVGPVPVAYSAEVYPSSVREVGMSFAISTASLWATVLSITFPMLLNGVGEQGSFALYALLNIVAFGLCWLFVRETKGVSLEAMGTVFEPSAAEFCKAEWADGPGRLISGRRRNGWKSVAQDDH